MAGAYRKALLLLTLLQTAGAKAAAGGAVRTVLYLEQHIDFSSAAGMQQKNIHRLWYDGRQLRAEIEGGKHKSVLLLDAAGQEVKLLFPAIRSWARYRLDEYARVLAARFGRLAEAEITLEETEQEESIGAFRCRRFILRSAAPRPLQSELCLAQVEGLEPGLYAELMLRLGLQAVFGRLFEKVQALEKIPVYVKSRLGGEGEQVLVQQRLMRVERRPLEPELFSVPGDFLEITDLQLPQAEQGGGK